MSKESERIVNDILSILRETPPVPPDIAEKLHPIWVEAMTQGSCMVDVNFNIIPRSEWEKQDES